MIGKSDEKQDVTLSVKRGMDDPTIFECVATHLDLRDKVRCMGVSAEWMRLMRAHLSNGIDCTGQRVPLAGLCSLRALCPGAPMTVGACDVSPRSNLSDAVVEAIRDLRTLDLAGSKVTWRDRAYLSPIVASVRRLYVGRASECVLRWPMPNLKELTVRGSQLGAVIDDLPERLDALCLDRCRASVLPPDAFRRWIRGLRVARLTFSDTQLGDSLVEIVADELHEDTRVLELERAMFKRRGAEAIARAIRRISTLRDVNVQGNRIADTGFLAIARSARRRIQHLDISECGISCRGADAGLEALSGSTKLLTLWTKGNHGDDAFADAGTRLGVVTL